MRTLLTCVGCLLVSLSFGQNARTISGQVTDSLQTPVSYASVAVYIAGVDEAIGGEISSETGAFSVLIHRAGPYRLVVSKLNYKPYSLTLQQTADQVKIILVDLSTNLSEVTVKAQRNPIQVRGDSTLFNVKTLRDGTERTVEDLLKKLPGVQVGQDGTVSFKGRQVESVYIDGDNMLGQKYRMATRNLTVDLVEEIQAVEHHNDNTVLKGIENSDKTILNLKIKNNRQAVVFGNAATGFGTNERADVSANVFAYKSKLKFYTLANYNNVGKTVDSDNNLSLIDTDANPFDNQPSQSQPAVVLNNVFSSVLPAERYTIGQTFIGSTTGVISIKPTLKIKPQFTFSSGSTVQLLQQQTDYLSIDTPFSVYQTDDLKNRSNRGELKITIEASPTETKKWVLITNFRLGQLRSVHNLQFKSKRISDSLTENLRNQGTDFSQQFIRTHRYSTNWASQQTILFTVSTLPQTYQLQSSQLLFASLFSEPASQLNQQANNPVVTAHIATKWIGKVNHNHLIITTGFNYNQYALRSNVVTGELPNQSVPLGFENNVSLLQQTLFGDVDWSQTSKQFSYQFGGTAKLFNSRVNTDADRFQKLLKPILETRLKLIYKPNKLNNFSLNYRLDQTPNEIFTLAPNPFLSNYRTLVRGQDKLLTPVVHTYSIQYNFSDFFTQTYASVRMGGRYAKNPVGYLYVFNPAFDVISNLVVPEREFRYATVSIDRYSRTLHGSVKLMAETNQQHSISYIREPTDKRLSAINNNRLAIEYSSAFKIPLNFVFKAEGLKTTIHYTFGDDTSVAQNQTYTFLGMLLFKQKQWFTTISANRIVLNGQAFNFLDARINIRHPKKDISFDITARNLLNVNTFSQKQLSDQSVSSLTYQLLPRYGLVTVNWLF